MIGGPSFCAPDEGGVPCPDCNQPQPVQALTAGDDRRHVICLCPDCTKPKPAPLTDDQMADVKTMQQAITEMLHAIKNPGWFTNGERAAMSHFFAWSQKGLDAIHRFGTPTTVEKVGM
jgi:hypothetical protein